MQFNEPLDFETVFAQQDAGFTTQQQQQQGAALENPVQSDAPLDQHFLYPNLPVTQDPSNITGSQQFFSTGTQEPLPPVPDILSANSAIAASQPETQDTPVPAQTTKTPKKPRARKKSTSSKARAKNGANSDSQSFPPTASQPDYQQEMNTSSFALGQESGGDPFVSNGTQPGSPSAGQAAFNTFNTTVPGIPQQPVGANAEEVQHAGQAPVDYSMFIQREPQASSPAPLPGAGSPPNHAAGPHTATPSSDNKRKAGGPHSMETPTKRRQSVNATSQSAVGSGIQHAPEQTYSQELQTPHRNPIRSSLYDISPPSGNLQFGTAIKAGICAAIRLIVKEVKSRGTIFSQLLMDGPATDFSAPETAGQIKQDTKRYVAAVNALNPEDDQQAFVNGAYKVLQAVVQEIEEHGTVFGKELLLGRIFGPALLPVKRCMANMYREIADSYTPPPPRPGSAAGFPDHQPQQTPTPAPRAAAAGQAVNGAPANAMGGGPIGQASMNMPQFPAANHHNHPLAGNTAHGHAAPGFATQSPQQQQQQQQHVLPPTAMTTATGIPLPTSVPHPNMPDPATVATDNNGNGTPSPSTEAAQQKRPRRKTGGGGGGGGRARKSTSPATAAAANSSSPKDGTSATATSSTGGYGQHVPRSLYHFGERSFYVVLSMRGVESRHRLGNGTTQLEAALARFLAAARAAGELLADGDAHAEIPGHYEFCQWLSVEQNLENLRRVRAGLPPVYT